MIVANISVYKCDDCGEYVSISSLESDGDFHAAWFTSLTKDFCPDCRNKIENLSAIEMAEELDRSAFDKIRDMSQEAKHATS